MNTNDILIQRAKRLNQIRSDSKTLFKVVNSCTFIDGIITNNEFSSDFQPVKFLRLVVATHIKKGKEIDSNFIDNLKEAIENRNVFTYMVLSESQQELLKAYKKSKKGMFPQWKEPFKILFPFLISESDRQNTDDLLLEIMNKISDDLVLENIKIHVVGFEGPQNYGHDEIWAAIYPSGARSVSSAYQLFLRISSEGIYGGIFKGSHIEYENYDKPRVLYDTLDSLIKGFRSLKSEWQDKNDGVDFQLEIDSKDFEKRIKSNSAESNGVFFGVLDKLIEDLTIINNEKIVFSTGTNQLTFQVGKRYCLLLKKNKFGFINPSGSKIEGLKRQLFSEPDPALFFKESSSEVFLNNYKSIKTAVEFELLRNNHLKDKSYDNKNFRRFVFDKTYRSEFKNIKSEEINIDINNNPMPTNIPLNQILYGPPGTGKTFNTINNALKIVDPEFYEDNSFERIKLKERFNEYVKKGNIVFTTFHQSMSYEDFIEGIKPVISNEQANNELEYEVQDGILKELVNNMVDFTKSSTKSPTDIVIDKKKFKKKINKVSLGNINEPEDDEIYKYCIKNNCIALGFGEDINFSGVKNRNDIRDRYKKNGIDFTTSMDFNISSIERLVLWMEEGQLVFISNGNKKVRAIGVISGDYYCDNSTPIRYSQFRKVNWLYADIEIPIKQIYGSYFSQQTIYQMAGSKFDLNYFNKTKKKQNSTDKCVLIIDEINRGNVSSIFGELITLLEPDKRKGNKEELEVVLPYSKEPFSIPKNLYIIGTMNTADRSVEALDTALRRRFSFIEMMPDANLLESNEVDGIQLKKVLSTINDRIEILIDRDHTIGHSYFMTIDNAEDLRLAFKDKIVPLLQEYFYGDYGKIGLVLGDGFIQYHKKSNNPFTSFKYDGKEELNRDFYKLLPIHESFDIKEAIIKLLNTPQDK
jgi:hypothetical protein